MKRVNHYKLINTVCDADMRANDAENPCMDSFTLAYFIALHNSMEKKQVQQKVS